MVETESLDGPVPTRRDDIVETLHGHRIADPYRWLEHSDDAEVQAWVAAQNSRTEHILHGYPGWQKLHGRLEELLAIGEISLPTVRRTPHGSRYFYTRRQGHQNQPVLWVRDGAAGKERPLLDPNALSSDGTTALDWYVPSTEGALLAYGVSEGGSEESTLWVREVATGKDLQDRITRARYSSVCWLPGGKRFFYSRFPAPGSVPKGEEKYHRRIYEHVLGRAADSDPLVFESKEMTDFPSCTISPNGRWLLVRVHQGWSKSSLWLADTSAPKLAFVELTSGQEHVYDPLAIDDELFIRTNEGAPRYALYAVDPKRPARSHWKLVVPPHPHDVLNDFNVVASELFVSYLSNASSRLLRFDRTGKPLGEVKLPTVGTNTGVSGLSDGDEAFYDFESVAHPPVVSRLQPKSGKTDVFAHVVAPISADDFAVSRGNAKSKDGTLVPYLVVRKKDVPLDGGDAPTLLYGYGGFNVSLLPRFSRITLAWLERGGVYVQANLRGGGELGEDWHRAGQLEAKQNVFDDFQAVARHLVDTRVTRPERLAIYGRSNGGLLVAAAITQHPEMYRAAVSAVPLTDMLRYDNFLIAKLWVSEYGSPEDPEQFEWLLGYSPYHHVKDGTAYPAVLMMTADGDTRVDPMHARKMAAALQHASSSGRPVLLRTEDAAGHGQGKPMSKVADEYADLYGFLLWQLGM
jgi:prolyl oligopeptidase